MAQISLIIAVYNRPEVLRLVLASVARQSYCDLEVIIADDGSGPEVKKVVEEAKRQFSFPIKHLWQDDLGWRKNAILNKAIQSSTADYLVFIDGDCIVAKHFLRDHWQEREQGKALLGRRVEMSERWTNSISVEDVKNGRFQRFGFAELLDGLKGKAVRLEDGVRVSNPVLRKLMPRALYTILGSNFSVHRSDMLVINGFDELYDGPGLGEDSDIQYRLSLIGVTGKSLRNLAIEFHMYHPRTKPSGKSVKRFDEVKRVGEARCKFGIKKPDAVQVQERI